MEKLNTGERVSCCFPAKEERREVQAEEESEGTEGEESSNKEETCLVCEALWAAAVQEEGESECLAKRKRLFRHFGGRSTYSCSREKSRFRPPGEQPDVPQLAKQWRESPEPVAACDSFGGAAEGMLLLNQRTKHENGGTGADARGISLAMDGRTEKSAIETSCVLRSKVDEGGTDPAAGAEDNCASALCPVSCFVSAAPLKPCCDSPSPSGRGEASVASQEKAVLKSAEDEAEEQSLRAAHPHRAVTVPAWRPPLALLEEQLLAQAELEVCWWRVADIISRRTRREQEEKKEHRQLEGWHQVVLKEIEGKKIAYKDPGTSAFCQMISSVPGGDAKREDALSKQPGNTAGGQEEQEQATATDGSVCGAEATPERDITYLVSVYGEEDLSEQDSKYDTEKVTVHRSGEEGQDQRQSCSAEKAEGEGRQLKAEASSEMLLDEGRLRILSALKGASGPAEADAVQWIFRELGRWCKLCQFQGCKTDYHALFFLL